MSNPGTREWHAAIISFKHKGETVVHEPKPFTMEDLVTAKKRFEKQAIPQKSFPTIYSAARLYPSCLQNIRRAMRVMYRLKNR
ncbi:hypothetical protein ESA94_20360 [Lacibacter luteus]|uniref:Uncharacterized protein n=1 Tax=Lacibacter luteus TaxID=2508719 RepID=A0A4Q1CDA3_9BACT|nr:hypothetical protein [Lacibacter luteus]RXK57554.1 hypothetical protein ESA94_20360 [Lacibacter luteus]